MGADLILVGRVSGAFGVRGEVRITSFTADPLSLLDYKDLKREDGSPGLSLLSGRASKDSIVVRAAGIEDRNQAEALRGLKLFIARADLPPPDDDDEFYVTDLIGLRAETPEGVAIGTIKSVHDFGAGDLLEIQPAQGPSWWLPFTMAAVPEVHLAQGRVVAVPPQDAPDDGEEEEPRQG